MEITAGGLGVEPGQVVNVKIARHLQRGIEKVFRCRQLQFSRRKALVWPVIRSFSLLALNVLDFKSSTEMRCKFERDL